MARRRIGQEDLIARPEPRAASSLPELAALLDWSEIDRFLTERIVNEPDPNDAPLYDRSYAVYRELYTRLADLFPRLS